MNDRSTLGGFTRDDNSSDNEKENEVRRLLQASRSKPKKRTLLYVALGVTAALFILGLMIGGNADSGLKVQLIDYSLRNDHAMLVITNVGTSPITITNIAVNERTDCNVSQFFRLPYTLNIGDKINVGTSCGIIRANITTQSGSYNYSFN